MTRLGPLAVALAAVLAACSAPAPAPAFPPPLRAPHVKLVVLIVIDQLPSWMFERDLPLYTGGIARLVREGSYVHRAELPYAASFTAPGHAAIATGAPPSVTGIVGNAWWHRAEGREYGAEVDPDAPAFPVVLVDSALPTAAGASARRLRVPGIADALRTATGGRAHSVAIALKARSACMVAGQHPDLAVWFDSGAGGMTTSAAYATAVPAWLVDHAASHPASLLVGKTWTARDPALLAQHTGIPDDAPGEGAINGIGVAFPHVVHDYDELLHTPFGDQLVADTALAAIDPMQLGADDVPDLLAISFSSHDYAGHNWGPDSWEVLDLSMRLDATLGALFADLDRRFGADGWAAVLASDHGATPVPERSPVAGARRFPPADIAKAGGPAVERVSSNQVYLKADQRAALPDVAAAIRAAYPEIDVFDTSDRSHCAEHSLAGDVCRSIVPGESGDLYLAPHRGFVITEYPTGTHHDAPNPDNLEVPVLVRVPGRARQVVERASLLQVAPTVAALLGVPAPAAATEPPLFGLAARSPARP